MAACAGSQTAKLTGKERIDRVRMGQEVDRPPYSFYYHFGLEDLPGEKHAEATLEFHRKFQTDLVKVMSDFPFPRPQGNWYELRFVEEPYPEQIRALEIIREGVGDQSYFIETIFNPWNVAEKLSTSDEVLRMKNEEPQLLLDTLEKIARSEASHAKKAVETGAAGVFLAIANAQDGVLSEKEYEEFSEPFDRMVLEAVSDAPLNTLHLHGERVFLEHFLSGWPTSVIQYSIHGTGIPFSRTRQAYEGILMGGIDEKRFRSLTQKEIRSQLENAVAAAGPKLILAPGCSVPDDTADEELMRFVRSVS